MFLQGDLLFSVAFLLNHKGLYWFTLKVKTFFFFLIILHFVQKHTCWGTVLKKVSYYLEKGSLTELSDVMTQFKDSVTRRIIFTCVAVMVTAIGGEYLTYTKPNSGELFFFRPQTKFGER